MLKKNIGPYLALNHVLKREKGFDAWYFHGADDISYEDHFHELAAPMINNPQLMMTYCNYKRVYYKTNQMIENFTGHRTSMCLWRSDVFNIIGTYDNTFFGGDTEYWDRFLLYFNKTRIQHIPKVLANCMIHKTNLTVIYNGDARREYVEQFKARHHQLQASLNF